MTNAYATPVTAVRKPTHAVARYSVRADSVECTCGETVTPAAAFTEHRTGKHRGRPPKAQAGPEPISVGPA